MRYAPSTGEERLGMLRALLKSWKSSGLINPVEERQLTEKTKTPWNSSPLISRAIYFVLTLVCVAAVYGLVNLAGFPEEVVTAVLCLGAAELLILRFGLFRAGPDEALYLAGLFFLIFALPGPTRDEGILLFAVALLVAGVRLRNGFFLTASGVAAIVYLAIKSDGGELAAFISLAIAFAGLALLNREWRHPVWNQFFSWVVVVMPALAYVVVTVDKPVSRIYVIVVACIIAAVLLFAGLAIRDHAPLIAGLMVTGLALYEIGRLLVLPIEFRLMILGALLGMVVLILHRTFGGRTSGITAEQLLDSDTASLLEPAAAAILASSQHQPAHPAGMEGRGGKYGGGGASGEF